MAELAVLPLLSDANLVAYWKLEDVADSKGTNTLTNNNTVTFTGAKYNNGANFGTGNTNKSLTQASNLGINGGSISLFGWVRMQTDIAAGGDVMFFQQANATSDVNFQVRYNGDPRVISFRRDKANVGAQDVTGTITLGTDSFYHVGLTYDTTNVIGYINGVPQGTTAASGDGNTSTTNGFSIGANVESSAVFASIWADDVYVFNRAINQAEVLTLVTDGGFMNTNRGYW